MLVWWMTVMSSGDGHEDEQIRGGLGASGGVGEVPGLWVCLERSGGVMRNISVPCRVIEPSRKRLIVRQVRRRP